MNFRRSHAHGFSSSRHAVNGQSKHNYKISTIVGIIILLLFIIGTITATQRKSRVQKELKDLQAQIAGYQSDNDQLGKMLSYLSSDAYVISTARNSLGLGKAGEQPLVLIQPTVSNSGTVAVLAEAKPPSNTQLWWNYFFAKN
jgi:cell division protein FtsB